MRFISQDDPALSNAQGEPLGSNLYAYCLNNPIMNMDPNGCWAQNYYGFKWTSKGFNVYAQLKFLSRAFCVSYALDIIRLRGKWYWWGKGYNNMSSTRIAQELWFHALAYYIGSPIKTALSKFGLSWKWLNDNIKKAYYMEINNNDGRAWVFSIVWYAGYAFKTYIRLARGYGFPYSYIHI